METEKQLTKKVDLRKLPVAQARVEIARDVIAALKVRVLEASRGDYFSAYTKEEAGDEGDEISIRDLFANKALDSCKVCALGALFSAKVGRLNEVSEVLYGNFLDLDRPDVADPLLEFFSGRQLLLIECAFEMSDMRSNAPLSTRIEVSQLEALDAMDFGAGFATDQTRMIGIMENIIKNKGTFKL